MWHWGQAKRHYEAYCRCPDLWPAINMLVQVADHLEAIATLEKQRVIFQEPSIFPVLERVYDELDEHYYPVQA